MARGAEAADAPGSAALKLQIDPSVPECLACGTCCFAELVQYIRVFGVDCERMDQRAQALTHFVENRVFMRMQDGHCAALVIDPDSRRFVCSIYEMRPDCCRGLERGSGACLDDLRGKRERPLLPASTTRSTNATVNEKRSLTLPARKMHG